MKDVIRFRFAPVKARAAIQMMLAQRGRMDLHTLLKACYFADKSHLNKHLRPIFGATYRAMKFGPVPLEIYEMAKGESLWLAELGLDNWSWALEGYHIRATGNVAPDYSVLSDTDREEIQAGLKRSAGMNFTERTAATHGPDWQAANLGVMKYEDMIEDRPDKMDIVAYLREAGPVMRL